MNGLQHSRTSTSSQSTGKHLSLEFTGAGGDLSEALPSSEGVPSGEEVTNCDDASNEQKLSLPAREQQPLVVGTVHCDEATLPSDAGESHNEKLEETLAHEGRASQSATVEVCVHQNPCCGHVSASSSADIMVL